VLVMLAMSASAAVDARALVHEGQKTQWAPTRNFSSLNARAVFAGESRGATSPYAGEAWETAAGEKDWQYAAGNPMSFTDPDGREVDCQTLARGNSQFDLGQCLRGRLKNQPNIREPATPAFDVKGPGAMPVAAGVKLATELENAGDAVAANPGAAALSTLKMNPMYQVSPWGVRDILNGTKESFVRAGTNLGGFGACWEGDWWTCGETAPFGVAESLMLVEGGRAAGAQAVESGMARGAFAKEFGRISPPLLESRVRLSIDDRPDLYVPRSAEIGAETSLADLLETPLYPGREGVLLTDSTIRFGNLHELSASLGVELSLAREQGRFVLRSGSYRRVRPSQGGRTIGHTHLPDRANYVDRFPSSGDLRTGTDEWMARGSLDPSSPQRVIFGTGLEENTIYYPQNAVEFSPLMERAAAKARAAAQRANTMGPKTYKRSR
jgi:hypothetical protein